LTANTTDNDSIITKEILLTSIEIIKERAKITKTIWVTY